MYLPWQRLLFLLSPLLAPPHHAPPLPTPPCPTAPPTLQLYILPDPGKLTKQKTRVSKDKAPKYDESFSW